MKLSTALILTGATTAAIYAAALTGTDWFFPITFALLSGLNVILCAGAFRGSEWRRARRERRGRYL